MSGKKQRKRNSPTKDASQAEPVIAPVVEEVVEKTPVVEKQPVEEPTEKANNKNTVTIQSIARGKISISVGENGIQKVINLVSNESVVLRNPDKAKLEFHKKNGSIKIIE